MSLPTNNSIMPFVDNNQNYQLIFAKPENYDLSATRSKLNDIALKLGFETFHSHNAVKKKASDLKRGGGIKFFAIKLSASIMLQDQML